MKQLVTKFFSQHAVEATIKKQFALVRLYLFPLFGKSSFTVSFSPTLFQAFDAMQ